MFHPHSHLNKHGFFQVGDECFYSKLDAIHHSMATGQAVQWNLNNHVYESVDWLHEPETHILDLYAQRAHQLRQKYDYIVVMFSGGSDSTTVLQTFFDNNIHVDEIQMQHWISATNDAESFMNAEITNAAWPFLQKHQSHLTKTLIRAVDIAPILRKNILDPDFRIGSMRGVNNVHNLGIISWHHNLHVRHQEYLDCYDRGKSVAFIWGDWKTKIEYDCELGKHYAFFEDQYGMAPQPRDQEANDPNCNHEQFFDDPSMPEIKVKQAHLLLHTLKQIKHRTDIFFPDSEKQQIYSGKRGFRIRHPRVGDASTFHNGQKWLLDRNAYHAAVYPNWNILTYHEDKQWYRLDHPSYQWLMDQEPEACKEWYRLFLKTYGTLPDYWKRFYSDDGGLRAKSIRRLKIRYYVQ